MIMKAFTKKFLIEGFVRVLLRQMFLQINMIRAEFFKHLFFIIFHKMIFVNLERFTI